MRAMSTKGRGIVRHKLSAFAVAAALAFAGAAALSADSRVAPRGGFLYSQWLQEPAAEPFAAGSFEVRASRPPLLSGTISEGLSSFGESALDIGFRDQALGYALGDSNEDEVEEVFRRHGAESAWEAADAAANYALTGALNAFDGWPGAQMKNIGVDIRSQQAGRSGYASFFGVSSLHDTLRHALVMEFRGFAGSGTNADGAGANLGLAYRRALTAGGGMLAGMNVYSDYESHSAGSFTRWSVGGELRSSWADMFGNYYLPITNPRDNGEFVHYTSEGFDFAMHVHAPSQRWLTGVFGYYSYEGEFGQDPDEGWTAGMRVSPPLIPSLLLEVQYDGTDLHEYGVGGRIAFVYAFRASDEPLFAAPPDEFIPRSWFFAPAEREYSQRIRRAVSDAPRLSPFAVDRIEPSSASAVMRGQGFTLTASYNASTDSFVLRGQGAPAAAQSSPYQIPTRVLLTLSTQPAGATVVLSYGGGPASGGGEVQIGGTAAVSGEALQVDFAGGGLLVSAAAGAALPEVSFGNAMLLAPGASSREPGSAQVFSVSMPTAGGGGVVGGNLGHSASCDGGPASIGGAQFVCELRAQFNNSSGGRIAPGVFAASGGFSANRTVASLVAFGGAASASADPRHSFSLVTLITVSDSSPPGALTFDESTGAAVLEAPAMEGDSYTLVVEVSDLASSGARPAVRATLALSVRMVEFEALTADVLSRGATVSAGGSATVTANTNVRVLAASVIAGGGSGTGHSYSLVAGDLELDAAQGFLFVPAASDGGAIRAGATLSAVVEVRDAEEDNEAVLRLTLFVSIDSVAAGSPLAFASIEPQGATVTLEGASITAVVSHDGTGFDVSGSLGGEDLPDASGSATWGIPTPALLTMSMPAGATAVLNYLDGPSSGGGEVRIAGGAAISGGGLSDMDLNLTDGVLMISAAASASTPEVQYAGTEVLAALSSAEPDDGGDAALFVLSVDASGGTGFVEGNLAHSAGCEGGPAALGGATFTCALRAWFVSAGRVNARLGIGGSFALDLTIATLSVVGGAADSDPRHQFSVSHNTDDARMSFDAASGAVVLLAPATAGGVYTLSVEVSDASSAASAQPAVTAGLTVTVLSVSFTEILVSAAGAGAPENGGVVSLAAFNGASSPVATVQANGGSGNFEYARIEGDLEVNMTTGVISVPDGSANTAVVEGATLSVVVEARDADSSNTNPVPRFTLLAVVTSVVPAALSFRFILPDGSETTGGAQSAPVPVPVEAAGGDDVVISIVADIEGLQQTHGLVDFPSVIVTGDNSFTLPAGAFGIGDTFQVVVTSGSPIQGSEGVTATLFMIVEVPIVTRDAASPTGDPLAGAITISAGVNIDKASLSDSPLLTVLASYSRGYTLGSDATVAMSRYGELISGNMLIAGGPGENDAVLSFPKTRAVSLGATAVAVFGPRNDDGGRGSHSVVTLLAVADSLCDVDEANTYVSVHFGAVFGDASIAEGDTYEHLLSVSTDADLLDNLAIYNDAGDALSLNSNEPAPGDLIQYNRGGASLSADDAHAQGMAWRAYSDSEGTIRLAHQIRSNCIVRDMAHVAASAAGGGRALCIPGASECDVTDADVSLNLGAGFFMTEDWARADGASGTRDDAPFDGAGADRFGATGDDSIGLRSVAGQTGAGDGGIIAQYSSSSLTVGLEIIQITLGRQAPFGTTRRILSEGHPGISLNVYTVTAAAEGTGPLAVADVFFVTGAGALSGPVDENILITVSETHPLHPGPTVGVATLALNHMICSDSTSDLQTPVFDLTAGAITVSGSRTDGATFAEFRTAFGEELTIANIEQDATFLPYVWRQERMPDGSLGSLVQPAALADFEAGDIFITDGNSDDMYDAEAEAGAYAFRIFSIGGTLRLVKERRSGEEVVRACHTVEDEDGFFLGTNGTPVQFPQEADQGIQTTYDIPDGSCFAFVGANFENIASDSAINPTDNTYENYLHNVSMRLFSTLTADRQALGLLAFVGSVFFLQTSGTIEQSSPTSGAQGFDALRGSPPVPGDIVVHDPVFSEFTLSFFPNAGLQYVGENGALAQGLAWRAYRDPADAEGVVRLAALPTGEDHCDEPGAFFLNADFQRVDDMEDAVDPAGLPLRAPGRGWQNVPDAVSFVNDPALGHFSLTADFATTQDRLPVGEIRIAEDADNPAVSYQISQDGRHYEIDHTFVVAPFTVTVYREENSASASPEVSYTVSAVHPLQVAEQPSNDQVKVESVTTSYSAICRATEGSDTLAYPTFVTPTAWGWNGGGMAIPAEMTSADSIAALFGILMTLYNQNNPESAHQVSTVEEFVMRAVWSSDVDSSTPHPQSAPESPAKLTRIAATGDCASSAEHSSINDLAPGDLIAIGTGANSTVASSDSNYCDSDIDTVLTAPHNTGSETYVAYRLVREGASGFRIVRRVGADRCVPDETRKFVAQGWSGLVDERPASEADVINRLPRAKNVQVDCMEAPGLEGGGSILLNGCGAENR